MAFVGDSFLMNDSMGAETRGHPVLDIEFVVVARTNPTSGFTQRKDPEMTSMTANAVTILEHVAMLPFALGLRLASNSEEQVQNPCVPTSRCVWTCRSASQQHLLTIDGCFQVAGHGFCLCLTLRQKRWSAP